MSQAIRFGIQEIMRLLQAGTGSKEILAFFRANSCVCELGEHCFEFDGMLVVTMYHHFHQSSTGFTCKTLAVAILSFLKFFSPFVIAEW